MTNWLTHATNPQGICAIFGESVPSLHNVILHEIAISRDGPRVTFRLDLAEFPFPPPTKWKAAGYNRVQIRLTAHEIKELRISGMETNRSIDFEVTESNHLLTVKSVNSAAQIEVICESLDIDGVTGYIDSALRENGTIS